MKRDAKLKSAAASCKAGMDALSGHAKLPEQVEPANFALFSLLSALQDIAEALQERKPIATPANIAAAKKHIAMTERKTK